MDSTLDFRYVLKQGDTLQGLAKQFKVPDWHMIYEHPSNARFRKKRPDPSGLQPGDVVVVPAGNVIMAQSGKRVTVQQTGTRLLPDGHMHIQSNNCAPLPIQWALFANPVLPRGILPSVNVPAFPEWTIDGAGAAFKALASLRFNRANRKELADLLSSGAVEHFSGRLGPIGRLPTDLVAQLYMGTLKNDLLRQESA